MSFPLQEGVRLLCRLCPLYRTLAFSRLFQVKRFESSPIPRKEVVVTLSSPPIRRAVFEAIPTLIYTEPDSRLPFWVGCISRFTRLL